MPKIYEDKENITAAPVNAAKATLAGPRKLKTQVRKPFDSVGNTIQSRWPSSSTSSKANVKSSEKVLKKTSPERLVEIEKTEAIPENVSPTSDDGDVWPEIEHMPAFYEPEDDYEDIWPRAERLSRDDITSLKCLPRISHDTAGSPNSLYSPIESYPYLLEFSPLDQSMFEMDCLEEPSELYESLLPLKESTCCERIEKTELAPDDADPLNDASLLEIENMPCFSEPEDNYEGIWPQAERLSHDDLVSLKFLERYKCTVSPNTSLSPISPLGQPCMFEMDSLVQEPAEINECLCPLPSP